MKNKSLPKAKQTNEEWFEKLPLDKHMFIAQQEKKKIDKIQKDTEDILDSCYIGAMIEVNEMELDNCIKIAEKANANMRITEQFLYKEGESYYMKVNNEELRTQIRKEAKEMLKSNPKESTIAISKELEKEYKMPFKDLHIIVAEARKEIKAESKKEDAADQEINIEVQTIGFEEASKLEVVEPKFVNPNKPKPQVKTIIEWQYGTYTKSSEGVKLEDKIYKNMEEVEKEKDIVYKNLNDEEIKLKKRIEDLNNQLQNVEVKREERTGIYEEIKAVFAM